MAEKEYDSLTPFVTLQDIMNVFSCEIDKARKIMDNPDLEKFPVGKTYYVTRKKWDEFITNLVLCDGLPDLSRRLSMVTTVSPGYAWKYLVKIGFTRDELKPIIEKLKKDILYSPEPSSDANDEEIDVNEFLEKYINVEEIDTITDEEIAQNRAETKKKFARKNSEE